MSRKVPAPRHERPVHRSDRAETVVVAIALGLLTGIVVGVVFNASPLVTVLVVVGVLAVAALISQAL